LNFILKSLKELKNKESLRKKGNWNWETPRSKIWSKNGRRM